jgi:branched-chain amino acid transport system ATP-binding protein
MSLLEVQSLASGYGSIPILSDISFSMNQGEFLGILGHNGMGKTTLLKTLIGILPATAGQIMLNQRRISTQQIHQRVRAGISYVPQGRGIFPALTVHENLKFASVAMPGKTHMAALEEVLTEIPRLKTLLDRPGGALSGGEQQILALARALIQKPRLVLLDEPTEGIQPSIIEEIVELLQRLRTKTGISVLLVEQNIDFIKALSDRVLVMQKGTIVKELSADLLSDAMALGDFDELGI